MFIVAWSLTRISSAAFAVRGFRNFVTIVQTSLCDSRNSYLFIILILSGPVMYCILGYFFPGKI